MAAETESVSDFTLDVLAHSNELRTGRISFRRKSRTDVSSVREEKMIRADSSRESPTEIRKRIEHLVRERTGGNIRDLHVSLDNGEVVISGRASSFYTKQLATHAVFNAIQCTQLTNDIEVKS